ncbi:hypothetical protein PM082_022060 [Marasmius tenuissimus]|nr:hypothetical protein PM082_022060 [Marasmius tenuissimus]
MRRIIALPEKAEVTPKMIQRSRSWTSVLNNPGAEDTFTYELESALDRFKRGLSSHGEREDLANLQGKCLVCQRVFSSAWTSIRHSTGSCFLDAPRIFDSSCAREGMVSVFRSRSAIGLVWTTLGVERMFDPQVGEMDGRGEWYRCLKCPDGCFIGTWSVPLKHEDVQDQIDNPVFQILKPDEVREMNLKDDRECWSCARCTVSAERLWTREVVAEHLRNK